MQKIKTFDTTRIMENLAKNHKPPLPVKTYIANMVALHEGEFPLCHVTGTVTRVSETTGQFLDKEGNPKPNYGFSGCFLIRRYDSMIFESNRAYFAEGFSADLVGAFSQHKRETPHLPFEIDVLITALADSASATGYVWDYTEPNKKEIIAALLEKSNNRNPFLPFEPPLVISNASAAVDEE